MNNVAVAVSDVSKLYRLGEVGTGSLVHDINRWWHRIRGREDPYLKIAGKNDRTGKGESEYVWALKSVSFDVPQGQVLGIIGNNGAGKSTLLKILSRVTLPTSGVIRAKGRIASLLEVGTGFHPELSGRANIYLNGAILGMRKQEITNKLDEIVDFSGCERYLDTPVKRYSSGMYVRLAFAVAAHLDPEILIVDEVLAVGDAEFQKKCLSKMQSISREGRTILFVSHNIPAIRTLCPTAVWLEQGEVRGEGDTVEVLNQYLGKVKCFSTECFWTEEDCPGNDYVRLRSVRVLTNATASNITVEDAFDIEIAFERLKQLPKTNVTIRVINEDELIVFNVSSESFKLKSSGVYVTCHVPGRFMNDGSYKIQILIVADRSTVLYETVPPVQFAVHEVKRDGNWFGKWPGVVRPTFAWTIA